jgi:hypothetical protein
LAGHFFFSVLDMVSASTSGDDVTECRAVANIVEAENVVPESTSSPGRPAVFCDAEVKGILFRRFNRFRIYGVVDKSQQESIVQAIMKARQHRGTKPAVVDFYDKENWRTWSEPASGSSGGERGPETPIRETAIN